MECSTEADHEEFAVRRLETVVVMGRYQPKTNSATGERS